jgi:hypothetical protein
MGRTDTDFINYIQTSEVLHKKNSILPYFTKQLRRTEKFSGFSIAQKVSRRFLTKTTGVRSQVTWDFNGQSGNGAGFPCQFVFQQLLHIH